MILATEKKQLKQWTPAIRIRYRMNDLYLDVEEVDFFLGGFLTWIYVGSSTESFNFVMHVNF